MESEFIEVRFNLPGFERKDLHIEIQGGLIRVRAQRKQMHEVARKDFYKSEKSSAAVFREMTLPAEILPESAETKYEQGVLTIRLRKRAAKRVVKARA